MLAVKWFRCALSKLSLLMPFVSLFSCATAAAAILLLLFRISFRFFCYWPWLRNIYVISFNFYTSFGFCACVFVSLLCAQCCCALLMMHLNPTGCNFKRYAFNAFIVCVYVICRYSIEIKHIQIPSIFPPSISNRFRTIYQRYAPFKMSISTFDCISLDIN